jgi:fumarate reductase subunit C
MDFVFKVLLFFLRLMCGLLLFVVMIFGVTLVLSVPAEYNSWVDFARATALVVMGLATITMSFIGIHAIPGQEKAT